METSDVFIYIYIYVYLYHPMRHNYSAPTASSKDVLKAIEQQLAYLSLIWCQEAWYNILLFIKYWESEFKDFS
jgi:hypothetical protein